MPKKSTPKKKIGSYYRYHYKGVKIDPYRIFVLYGINHPAQQHAIKKLLRAGRSIKDLERDIDEVIASLNRWKEMMKEDAPTPKRKRKTRKRKTQPT